MLNTKKGQLDLLRVAGIALAVITIIVAVSSQVLGEIKSTQTSGTAEYNVTEKGIEAQTQLANFLKVIAVVVAAVVIIALVSRFGSSSL